MLMMFPFVVPGGRRKRLFLCVVPEPKSEREMNYRASGPVVSGEAEMLMHLHIGSCKSFAMSFVSVVTMAGMRKKIREQSEEKAEER